MTGSSANERFEASAAGARLHATRATNDDAETLDSGGIELLNLLSFGGSDTIVVNNLAGTALKTIDASLSTSAFPVAIRTSSSSTDRRARTRSRPPATPSASPPSPASPPRSA
jgi:hypothetical protein